MGNATITGPPPGQWRPPRRTGGAGGGGTVGPPGPAGPAGVGVPAGGAAGQVLEKASGTDYDTIWATVTGGGGLVVIQPTPPVAPAVGSLWWRNDPDGTLFVYYNDGNSSQFVPATPVVTPAAGAFRYVQASAATVWTITHGLGFRPNVTAVDSTGREIIPGTVDYTSTTVTLTFSAAVGGEAYLS